MRFMDVRAHRRRRHARRWCRAPATPARTASRSRSAREDAARPRRAAARRRRTCCRSGSAPATRCGSRPGSASTGHDIDATTTPVEAALEWAIQPARRRGGARAGGFPGDAVDPRPDRRGRDAAPGRPPPRGARADARGHRALRRRGRARRSARSPPAASARASTRRSPWATCRSRRRRPAPGSSAGCAGRCCLSTVAKMPFITPGYKRA